MSTFIKPSDYDATIHAEIITAITRNDNAAVELAENFAIEEMRSYLNKRFNCDELFAKEGTERNVLILMFAMDIALYHMHTGHNPRSFPQIRKDRYDRAIDSLKMMQKGEMTPTGLPLIESTEPAYGGVESFAMTSKTKRNNAF
jgi:phage gp36-like protein